MQKFLRRIFFLLSAPKCASCEALLSFEDGPLCPDCQLLYQNAKKRNCSSCARLLSECTCTNRLLDDAYVHSLIKVYRYRPGERDLPSNDILYRLKRDYRRDVIDFLADELSDAIRHGVPALDRFCFTNVPRRGESVSKYGYDHAAELAKACAKRLGIPYCSLLISGAKKAQKKMSQDERLENAVCRARRRAELPCPNVILVDDIVTTGASMAAAAKELHKLGAKSIVGATLTIAYSDHLAIRKDKHGER